MAGGSSSGPDLRRYMEKRLDGKWLLPFVSNVRKADAENKSKEYNHRFIQSVLIV